jgi:hypothetical protein
MYPKVLFIQPPNGGQFGDSPQRSLPRKPPFNPLVGSFKWLTPDPHMFISSWHQPPIIQPIPEPVTKLQYPTYVKDTDLDAHIRMFKKTIKANVEIMEFEIINLFGFTLKNNISKWGENFVQNHPNRTFESRSKHFASDSEL